MCDDASETGENSEQQPSVPSNQESQAQRNTKTANQDTKELVLPYDDEAYATRVPMEEHKLHVVHAIREIHALGGQSINKLGLRVEKINE